MFFIFYDFFKRKERGDFEFGMQNSEFVGGFWIIIDLILGKEENVGIVEIYPIDAMKLNTSIMIDLIQKELL